MKTKSDPSFFNKKCWLPLNENDLILYVQKVISENIFWFGEKHWVSDWLLFNANSTNVQPCNGENKIMFNEIDYEVHFVLDPHDKLDFYSANSLKQQYADGHVAPHYPDSEPTCLCSFSLAPRR